MKYVFTSSRAWEGDLVFAAGHSGLSGSSNASILCNNVARDAGLGSSTAIITQPGRDPATYLPLNGPWYRTDGELVFATRDELLAGTPRVPINLDERGQSPGGYGSAWTGLTFSADGGLAPSTRACDGWTTSNAGTLGTSGSFSATNATWLNAGISNGSGSSCSTALHLYCIEH